MHKLKVGIVGCLGRGKAHKDAIAGSNDLEIVAVCDIRQDAAQAMAGELGCACHTDYDEFLKAGGFDLVDIVTPACLHHAMTVKALKTGCHVMVEKPMAENVAQAEEMIATAAANRRKLAMISQRRFSWTLQSFQKLLCDKKIGCLLHAEINQKFYRPPEYYTSVPTRGIGNGVLAIQGAHALDWVCWLFGEVEYVYNHNDRLWHAVRNEDFSASLLKFKSGLVLRLDVSHCTYPAEPMAFKIWGEKGKIEAVFGGQIIVALKDRPAPEVLSPPASIPDETRLQLDDFARAIRTDTEPFVSGKDGLAVMRLMAAMYKSAGTGTREYV